MKIDVADELDYKIIYKMESELGCIDFERYVNNFKAEIVLIDNSGKKNKVIGKANIKILLLDLADNNNVSVYDVFDTDEHLFWIGEKIFDFEENDFNEKLILQYEEAIVSRNITVINSIEILPKYRKQNLGKKNEIHNFDKKNENDNNKENNFLEFVDLSEFIKKNSFVNLAIWQNFCQENNLEKSEISLKEIHQSTLLSFWRTGDLELWADLAGTFWEREIKNWLIENNYKTGDFLWPLRVTLSGQKQSPSPFEILACLDLLETKKRIETCLVS